MKLLACSDWHLDWTTAGVRRLSDLKRSAEQTVHYAVAHQVDAYLFLGDLMNPDSGSKVFACLEVAVNVAMELAREDIESFWLAGNHDVIEDGTGNTTLTPMRGIHKLVHVIESPGVYRFRRNENIRLLGLPYPSLARSYDPAEEVRDTPIPGNVYPIVIAGHMTSLPGVKEGSEATDLARGRGIAFPIEECARFKNALLLNGHFHEQQTFRGVHIPGALGRLTFGEQDFNPGYLVVEV